MTFFSWSQTAASNNTADSTINWREGQAPSTVNNSSRAMMAALAKWRDDVSGALNTGGSSTAYTVTTNQSYTALSDGITVVVRLDQTCGADPTFSPDSLTAKQITTDGSTNVASGSLIGGGIYKLTYDSSADAWIVHGHFASTLTADDIGFGTDDTPQLTGLELGHASDTTLTRASAGDVNIEGNIIYRAGGTNVAIADGGTNADTAAAAFSNLKQAASDSATGVVEIAVQSEMEAASSTNLAVTPGRQHFHPGHPKAWVKYDNNGTLSNDQDYGVASLTDLDVGAVRVTYDTAFSAATYAILATSQRVSGGNTIIGCVRASTTPATTSSDIATVLPASDNEADVNYGSVSFLGDQ